MTGSPVLGNIILLTNAPGEPTITINMTKTSKRMIQEFHDEMKMSIAIRLSLKDRDISKPTKTLPGS
ncbi:hypothetical protein E6H31_08890 [Candidatus Bathyarchaeota archaeon]|nr:MAG: hypothetical protein E6H31_08890 [Candidatus Bathyarchaeota archaeon]